MDTNVGPFHIDVLEGLKKVRYIVDSNEHGIQMDVTWDAACPAVMEGRHFRRQYGRVTFDTSRFAQTGYWSGSLRVNGTDYKVTPDRWWGTRDRSWGVRPVGEAEPPGIRASGREGGFGGMWQYYPMQFDDFSIVCIMEEAADGSRGLETATRVWADGSRTEHLGRPDHDHVFTSGTRLVQSSTISFTRPGGERLEVKATPLLPVYLTVGSGYGGGLWGHGTWHGELAVEGEAWNMKEHPELFTIGFTDSVCRYETEGRTGYGLFEFSLFGAHNKYGFKSFSDVAP
jgi:hypothetical protein